MPHKKPWESGTRESGMNMGGEARDGEGGILQGATH